MPVLTPRLTRFLPSLRDPDDTRRPGHPADSPREPRFGPNWFNPQPFYAVEAVDWRPGEPLRLGPDTPGLPGTLAELEPGTYTAQAVLRLNPDTHQVGTGVGNAHGPPRQIVIEPGRNEPQRLEISARVADRPVRETDQIKQIDLPSPLLSEFHGRPIRQRATVLLPEPIEGNDGGDPRYPTLYIVPGFGGDGRSTALGMQRAGLGRDRILVGLDPDCGTGHHVFADSANNGPRGRALIEELIPHIEAQYPAIPEPEARLLTGHSSGGWSTLWLQVAYPEFFGGVWAIAPDPVDFRDFQRIDLYAPDANMFRDADGNRRPLARRGVQPVLWYEDFSRMEDVLGEGGQLRSFEAVFSPRGDDGKPLPLYDRQTGAVNPEVAEAWKAYDLRLILETNWDELAPKLAGKLHVIMGDLDTFYLEGAVVRLKEALERLGSDASIEVLPGKDHGSVLSGEVFQRMDEQMRAAATPRAETALPVGGGEASR